MHASLICSPGKNHSKPRSANNQGLRRGFVARSYSLFAQVCEALISEGGYDPDTRSELGVTPMMLAAQEGHLAVVEYLLGAKASYVAQAKNGAAAIHEAVIRGHIEIVRLLTQQANAKFTWNMVGKGATPLQLAVLMARQDCLRVLLEAGARLPEGPPPAAYLHTLKGPPSQMARLAWLEAFYMTLLVLLPSIQGDAQRIFDTFECIKLFQRYHKPPMNGDLNARLSETEWDVFFPPPPEIEDGDEAAVGGSRSPIEAPKEKKKTKKAGDKKGSSEGRKKTGGNDAEAPTPRSGGASTARTTSSSMSSRMLAAK